MMRHRTISIFGLTALAATALCVNSIDNGLDSPGAGGSPPKGDSNDVILGGDSDKVKVDDGILAVGEGVRDMTHDTTGGDIGGGIDMTGDVGYKPLHDDPVMGDDIGGGGTGNVGDTDRRAA